MKFNTAFVSTVFLACAGLAVGVDVGPFTPWRSVSNSNLCVVPSSTANGASLVVKACDGSLLQLWSWLKDGTNIYRLQNGGTPNACAWINDGGPFNGQHVIIGECTLSDGSGNTVSNAQWDSGTGLPNVVQLKSHIHFSTTSSCIDIVNSNVVMEGCNSASLTQKWIVGE
ncbi:hypothetical protein MVEN_01089200 [Mycena venus]|uniref:Ricin B lectin domain-containing protein n=1 Tax=Mycena venus TaxID=2733690 RepID=A0A8H7CXC5_9AGAR|nr:hypothetical protein MVEN_01089200 [Mycena venus]